MSSPPRTYLADGGWEFHPPPPTRRFSRPWLFAAVFLACLAGSEAYVWRREPVYQAVASVLTTAPAGLPDTDVPLVLGQPSGGAWSMAGTPRPTPQGTEHLAVQQRILLGASLLRETLRRLDPESGAALTVEELHEMLAVVPTQDTSLVELRARGPKPALLATVVDAWIDAYQALRERSVRESENQAATALQSELEQLERKIGAFRLERDRFGRRHGIVARTDTTNQALARLNGLNTALNKALADAVAAQGQLDAIRAAQARGESVLPSNQQAGEPGLEQKVRQLREQLKDLRRRYTPRYLALDPKLRQVPEELERAEAALRRQHQEAERAAVSEAERGHASARQSVQALERQIEVQKGEAAEFTAHFSEYQNLAANLEQLELLQRQKQARLVQAQVKPADTYPPLQVVARAFVPNTPIWPAYRRDSAIALGGSLATALLVLLLYDYLRRPERPPAGMKLPDIRVYTVSESLLPLHQAQQAPAIPFSQADTLPLLAASQESQAARILTEPEIRRLLAAAPPPARQVLGLLLSGLSLEEIAALRVEDIDYAAHRLIIGGEQTRFLPLGARLGSWLLETGARPAWPAAAEPDDLAALITCALADAGLPHTLDAAAIRHSYIAYLVRQGIRLAELEQIVGKLPPRTLAAYAPLSPAGPGLPATRVALIHPALAGGN